MAPPAGVTDCRPPDDPCAGGRALPAVLPVLPPGVVSCMPPADPCPLTRLSAFPEICEVFELGVEGVSSLVVAACTAPIKATMSANRHAFPRTNFM